MPIWMLTAGKWAGLLTIITLIIALLQQIIAFVGFLMFAIKASLVIAFVAVFLLIGILLLRTVRQRRRERQDL